MAELVADCPRCGAHEITFDAMSGVCVFTRYSWQEFFETFCRCRRCNQTTVFLLNLRQPDDAELFRGSFQEGSNIALNNIVEVDCFISLKDRSSEEPPNHLPEDIDRVFREAATCVAVGCWNAAGTMFRTTVDLATRPLLPDESSPEGPNRRTRRDLGLRLPWLFDNKLLPEDLRELSNCIREDGNDGAHEGTLEKADAEDLRDFTRALLERLFTQPAKLKIAEQRREDRRSNDSG